MDNRHLPLATSAAELDTAKSPRLVSGWLLDGDAAQLVSRRGLDEQAARPPLEDLVVHELPRDRNALGEREEGLPHIVDVVDLPGASEDLHLAEVSPLVSRHGDRDAALVGRAVALAQVPVVVCVQDPIGLRHPDLADVIQHGTRAQVDQDGARTIGEHVHVADVALSVKVVRYPLKHAS